MEELEFKEVEIFINDIKVWTYDFGFQQVSAGSQAQLSTQPVYYSPPGGIQATDQIKIGFRQLHEL